MMYHPITFGCKKISSSANMVETVIFDQMSPHCDPELEDQSSCTSFWPIMCHHHTKFGYRRFSSRGDIIQMNIHWNSELFLWPWLLPWPQQSNPIFMMMYHQTKFTCKRISSSDNISKSQILIILFLTVTMTLKTANQSFWKTIWPIMMHHHIKLGSKGFSDLENS